MADKAAYEKGLNQRNIRGSRNSVGAHVSEVMGGKHRTIQFEDLSKRNKGLEDGTASKRRNSLNFVVNSALPD